MQAQALYTEAEGCEVVPASASFSTPTFGSRFTQTPFHTHLKVFSGRFSPSGSDLFTKGRLSSSAVHNGISQRKSDEQERVFLRL